MQRYNFFKGKMEQKKPYWEKQEEPNKWDWWDYWYIYLIIIFSLLLILGGN